MPNPHPFRHMRLTLKLVQLQVALLLATEGFAWVENDYALMFVMNEMIYEMRNPTYPQYIGALGAYLRFYKRLVDRLPEGAIRDNVVLEFGKLSMGYEDLIEVQPSKQ